MFNVIFVGAALASILAVPASPGDSAALAAPPGDRITVEVVTVNGSGCKAGTAAVAMASDNTAFTVTYSDYTAQVGPDAVAPEARKNCQLNLRVNIPQGFTYAIAQADYRGFAHLAAGAKGLEQAAYYFQGNSATAYVAHEFAGPMSDDWQTTDSTAVEELVFAPCGKQRNLNINTELRVDDGTSSASATSFIAMDSTDASVRTIYHLAWKQCA